MTAYRAGYRSADWVPAAVDRPGWRGPRPAAASPPERREASLLLLRPPTRRRKRRAFSGVGGGVLIWVGLLALGLTGLAQRLEHDRRWRSLMRYRLAGALAAACAVFLFSAVSVYAVVLPRAGVHVPGQNTFLRLISRVPQPWKPQRPAYVPAPESVPPAVAAALAAAPSLSPSAMAPADGIGPARTSDAAVIGDVLPARTSGGPASTLPPPPPSTKLEGFKHQWQTWNNCGPASITMALSYFGRDEGQTQAMNFLKTTPDDKNVRPDEMVAYARSRGLQADWRVGGDETRLKQLLANSIPVIVEVNYSPTPDDWSGHYRLLIGYDDSSGKFIAYDSVVQPGIDVPQPYGKFEDDWRQFDYTYILVYKAEQTDLVNRLLGRDRDDRAMFEHALEVAQGEAAAMPDNGFAWFNVGTNLTALGRTAEAAVAYDRARSLKLPFRMLWYQFGPFEAYLAEGRFADVINLARADLQQTSGLEENHYFLGRALQAQGQLGAAKAAYQAALRDNSRYTPAVQALDSLG